MRLGRARKAPLRLSLPEWISRHSLFAAFVVCLVPRVLAVIVLAPIGDYFVFADPNADQESHWYPLYRSLAEILWSLSAGSVGVYIAWHLVLHAALGPIVLQTTRLLGLGEPRAAALGRRGRDGRGRAPHGPFLLPVLPHARPLGPPPLHCDHAERPDDSRRAPAFSPTVMTDHLLLPENLDRCLGARSNDDVR